MSCTEVAELLPAYALHAVSDEERAQIEAHLLSCELHAEAREFELVAARLPEAIPERAPPDDLRARLLASAQRGADVGQGARDQDIVALERQPRMAPAQRRGAPWLGPRFVWYALAAALALVVVGFVSLSALSDSDDGAIVRTAQSNGVSTTLVYRANDASADVTFEGLPALEGDRTYQLWTIAPGAPARSIGLVDRDPDGSAAHSLSGAVEEGTTFAITVEPAGGSEQPTTDPVISVRL